MNLYLSEIRLSGDISRDHAYMEAVQAVLSFCSRNSIHCWRSFQHTSYVEIEKRIRDSEIFIALIDKTWILSTWKRYEYYASGGGLNLVDKTKGVHTPKRIAVLLEGIEFPSYLSSDPAPVTVVHNISDLNYALQQIQPA